MNTILSRLTGLSLALLTAPTWSQGNVTEDGQRLYRVELLIVQHRAAGAAAAERWDATPALAYPDAARFFSQPAMAQSVLEEFRDIYSLAPLPAPAGRGQQPPVRAKSSGRNRPPLCPALPPPAGSPAAPGAGQAERCDPFPGQYSLEASGRLRVTLPDAQGGGQDIARRDAAPSPAPDSPQEPVSAPLYTPFELLEPGRRELSPGAARMARSGRYRVLFHETWIQAVQESSAAVPLVLDDSGNRGDWPELQGSIRLYLSRYLHLETNLWLNTDGSYLPGKWWMPPPPLGPASIEIDGLPLHEARAEITRREQAAELARNPRPSPPPGGLPAATDGSMKPAGETSLGEAAAEEETGPSWPFRHSVAMVQKRRMRSGEVHYLDHPMLGVIIQLTPLDLEAMAAAAEAP